MGGFVGVWVGRKVGRLVEGGVCRFEDVWIGM